MANRKSESHKKTISPKWRKIFKQLPGYDPIETAQPGQWFDEDRADECVAFFETRIHHCKGSKATHYFKLEPWQQAIIGCLFGWKNSNGMRRYREAFIFVPRKNGKTTLAAGIPLLVLYSDGEPGAECYCAATDRDQAGLLFGITKQMILQEPDFKSTAELYETSKTIKVGTNIFKAISSEVGSKHGYNSHLIIMDELHAQPNAQLAEVLETSIGARDQPLIIHITTSDYERPSVCNRKHRYASNVRDGIIKDDTFLPVIYEATKTDNWKDEKTWEKANPNLDISVSRTFLRHECQ